MAAPKRYHHHYRLIYTPSLRHHLTSVIAVLLVLVITLTFVFSSIYPKAPPQLEQLSFIDILLAAVSSLERLLIAYTIALFLAIPMAFLITATPKIEKVLLPFFDVLESVPVLAFFPVVALVFIKIRMFEGAAIFILVLTMVWSLVFSMIGGLKTTPEDIREASLIFRARGLKKVFYITLPSIFPFLVTGSILAWASGWNILIVAEVLHNYLPGSSSSIDLTGLGNLLVESSVSGNQSLFILTLAIMVLIIALINFFIWQKLLKLSERYKFE